MLIAVGVIISIESYIDAMVVYLKLLSLFCGCWWEDFDFFRWKLIIRLYSKTNPNTFVILFP